MVLDAGVQKPVTWDAALEKVTTIISGSGGTAVALVSPSTSTESLFLLKEILSGLECTGAFRVNMVAGDVPLPGMEDLALREERAPNAAGARLLGYGEGFDEALESVAGASVLFVLDESLEGVPAATLSGAANVIYMGSELPETATGATVVLPSTTLAEEDGCFVNRDGRVQRYHAARPAPGEARPGWQVLSELLAKLDRGEAVVTAAEAFALLAGSEGAFEDLSYDALGQRGATVRDGQTKGVGE